MLIILLLAIIQIDAFWLKVSPQAVAEGGTVRLMCHVPRSPDNRWVELGIQNYRASRIPLEGENSPITHQIVVQHVPCGVGSAYCMAGGIDESKTFWFTKLPLLVSGCDQ